MTRRPLSARLLQIIGSSRSKNCPSSIATTSVSGFTASSSSRADATFWAAYRMSLWETT